VTRIGADVGGTFTDIVVQHPDGRLTLDKVLSTPPHYDQAVHAAVIATGAAELTDVVHGTTVATNTVLEHRGARTALVTTAGFRDVLELRRLRMPHMYDLFWQKPPAIVPRDLRFEIDERVTADGEVLRALTDDALDELAQRLAAAEVESIAVCLLHSHRHPAHEQQVADFLRQALPAVTITASVELLREEGEYERSATTVINAYVRPVMERYVNRLTEGLRDAGVDAPVTIMRSSGGLMTADDAARRPVFALESGPAAGVIAAAALAVRTGLVDVIAFDMGGTTAKASLIEGGGVTHSRDYEVGASLSSGSRLIRGSGELIKIPTLDIAEVGAGGGSIAWLDAAGGLNVGPRSAGAEPGPACYGRGGAHPTVTDANVLLGFMRTGPIGDGTIRVDATAAERAAVPVAEQLGVDVPTFAAGVHRLANARMMRALRAVSSERGRDPAAFTLIAYGGGGPIHAAGLAAELGVRSVIVPPMAGVFSATGLLQAQPEFHAVRPCFLLAQDTHAVDDLNNLLADMRTELDRHSARWQVSADLRYLGQNWDLEILAPTGEPRLDGAGLADLVARFGDEHERTYGVRYRDDHPVELRAIRLAALLDGHAQTATHPEAAPAPTVGSCRGALFDGVNHDVEVIDRFSLSERPRVGPVLVDEFDTTTVVPPGWTISLDPATAALLLENTR